MKTLIFSKINTIIILFLVSFVLSLSAQECGWLKIQTPDATKGYPINAGTLGFSTNAITFETWIRGNRDGIIAGCFHSVQSGFYLRPSGGNSGLQFGSLTSQLYLDIKQPTDTTTWYHFAMVIDGMNVKFYKNGVLTSSKDNASTVPYTNTSADQLFIGDSRWVHGKSNFSFANVRLWNYARTADDIAANYQTSVAPGTPGLVINYTFMEQQGSTTANVTNPGTNGGVLQTISNGISQSYDATKYKWGKIGVVPTYLSVSNKTTSGFDLSWTGSDDNQWDVEIDDAFGGNVVNPVSQKTATVTGLTGTDYTVKVRATWPIVTDWSSPVAVGLTTGVEKNVSYNTTISNNAGVVSINRLEGTNDITIYSISGSLVKQFKTTESSCIIDATKWLPGLYLFKVNNDKKNKILKVVI